MVFLLSFFPSFLLISRCFSKKWPYFPEKKKKEEEEKKEEEGQGWIQSLVMKVVDNLQIFVDNVLSLLHLSTSPFLLFFLLSLIPSLLTPSFTFVTKMQECQSLVVPSQAASLFATFMHSLLMRIGSVPSSRSLRRSCIRCPHILKTLSFPSVLFVDASSWICGTWECISTRQARARSLSTTSLSRTSRSSCPTWSLLLSLFPFSSSCRLFSSAC